MSAFEGNPEDICSDCVLLSLAVYERTGDGKDTDAALFFGQRL
jgi:hypothetical protein